MRHTKTDPACREYRGYREPRNPITRYLDRRARGKSCHVCFPPFKRGELTPWATMSGSEVHIRGEAPKELF